MTKDEIKKIREIKYEDCKLCESEKICNESTVAFCKTKRMLNEMEGEGE